jgi:serine/threonine protein kinase
VKACSCAVHGHAPESPLSWSPGQVETWLVEPPLAFVVIDFRAEDLNGMAILQLDDRGKFLKELEIAHKARHPFVVSMLGACVDDDGMFLLMEWMDDGSLFDAFGNQVRNLFFLVSVCQSLGKLQVDSCIFTVLASYIETSKACMYF